MFTIEYTTDKDFELRSKRPAAKTDDIIPVVQQVLDSVRNGGDRAVRELTMKFDNSCPDNLLVTEQELIEAEREVPEDLKQAILTAKANIEKFHKSQIPTQIQKVPTSDGIICWQKTVGIEKVGIYIPGGSAPLFSTVLMLAIPAKLAGCKEIVLCSPPRSGGNINSVVLYCAKLLVVTKIFKIGGAQAIAALAYGTESVPQVEKIVGPGNIFVTAAKKLVYGQVDIEFPAGPSEVLILADETANPEFLATDILAQAEHDPNASCFLVTDSEELALKTDEFVKELTEAAPRREIIEESLSKSGKIIITDTFEEAIYVTNEYAPEHLIISTKDDDETLSHVNNAGSIFLGAYSPDAAGDYGSGTNHVLPTGGGAKMYSGLSTEAFIKKPTVQRITKEGLEELSKTSVPIAEYEGFFAHANSFKKRLE